MFAMSRKKCNFEYRYSGVCWIYCRAPCGRVDWNNIPTVVLFSKNTSRPVWARGLKHFPRQLHWHLGKSRPVWARGLKQQMYPHPWFFSASRPVWARGLKQRLCAFAQRFPKVAPRVGAWIETTWNMGARQLWSVAPRVGAWIETRRYFLTLLNKASRAPCGRVDWNLPAEREDNGVVKSRPVWARGLKRSLSRTKTTRATSRPVWARGLKPVAKCAESFGQSRAPCGRVDWNFWFGFVMFDVRVAPRVGAWIETLPPRLSNAEKQSRPVWARFNILENKLCPAWVEIADQHD